MEIISVLHELARSSACGGKKDSHTKEAPSEHDHLAFKKRFPDARVLRCRVVPSPDHPSERLVDAAPCRPQQRLPERWLIFETGAYKLRRGKIHDKEQQQSEAGRPPVV